jgi:predicted transglutaminase-like cysteine proteinase
MLKIIFSLTAFAAVIWLPIIIYVFLERTKPAKSKSKPKVAASVAHQYFGKGSVSHFSHYLQGDSKVAVNSIRDIFEWLLGCQYVPDLELFDHPDLWQHPSDFEKARQGDCEDHCLWAWRKLHDLGIDAEFVVGKIAQNGGGWGDHTWILLKNDKTEHILEATAKRMDRFVVSESRAKRYRPYYSMDTKLRSYVHQPQRK